MKKSFIDHITGSDLMMTMMHRQPRLSDATRFEGIYFELNY